MSSTIFVNPFRCRMWQLHDRLEEHISEESCRAEIASIAKHGQLIPALGRSLKGDPDYDVELIYGARRLFVARFINKPLAVEVRELTDREAIVAMDIENRQRVDISPYERGMSYTRWLRGGHFQSQDDLARALKVSPSVVSRLLKLARLPSVLVDAFGDPSHIRETWGTDLIEAVNDPQKRQLVVREARSIAGHSHRPAGCEVYRRLLAAAAPGRKVKARAHDEVVADEAGRPLFRIRQQRNSIAVVLPAEKISTKMLGEIREAVASILECVGTRDSEVTASTRVGRTLKPRVNPEVHRSVSAEVDVAIPG